MSDPDTLLCLDIATVTGCAEWSPASPDPRFYTVRFSSSEDGHPETFARARRWIDDRLSIGDVAAVYVESTNLGALMGHTTADTIKRLVGLNAVISSACGVWRIRYRDVDVHTARSAFLGRGVLKSAEAKARAMEMARAVGWNPANLDEADAAAVLYFCMVKEAPKSAPLISPMLQHQVATAAENARILRDQQKREKGMRRRA